MRKTSAKIRRAIRAQIARDVKRQNDCSDGHHIYDRQSIMFRGQRACRCGAVEGERPN